MGDEKFWNAANFVTIARFLILIALIIMLNWDSKILSFAATILIPFVFFLDWLDGTLARKLKVVTNFGSYADVVADRATEILLWVFFLSKGLVPFWVVFIIIVRGLITDAIRTKAQISNISVYDLTSSKIGKILVNSKFVRFLTAFCKLLLFTLLGLYTALNLNIILVATNILVYAALIINLLRGVPVIYDGIKLFSK